VVEDVSVTPIRTYRLRIDGQLFEIQRQLLVRITDLARRNVAYAPTPGDEDLLEGLLELTDALADEHTDRSQGA